VDFFGATRYVVLASRHYCSMKVHQEKLPIKQAILWRY